MVLCGFGKIISDLRSDFSNIVEEFILWNISTICVEIFTNPLTHKNRRTRLRTSMLDLIVWDEYFISFSIACLNLKFNLSLTLFHTQGAFDIDDPCKEKDAGFSQTEHVTMPSDQFFEIPSLWNISVRNLKWC